MYDDASFYAFVPSAHVQDERPQAVKHSRKVSLLAQPSVSSTILVFAWKFCLIITAGRRSS